MRKNKSGGISGGDWSDTGTFVRKPATGWLHKDTDLTNGAYVKYKLYYLGCLTVHESMRSLQYQTRTMVTREAITRLSESSDRTQVNKKRKMPKQVAKILGDPHTRYSGEVNLCIDIDRLQIFSTSGGRELMTHGLTTISFASGGEGATQEFIGYVAKDHINDRACHVFHCPYGTSQLVLATLGQAFELRYKMYLESSSIVTTHSATSSPFTVESHSQSHPLPPPVPEPRVPESRFPESRLPEPRLPEPRLPEPRFPEPRLPEPRLPEPRLPSEYRRTDSSDHSRYISGGDRNSFMSTRTDTYKSIDEPPPLQSGSYFQGNKKKLPPGPPPMTEVIHAPLPPLPTLQPVASVRPRVYSSLPGFPDPEPELEITKCESDYEVEDDLLLEERTPPKKTKKPKTSQRPPTLREQVNVSRPMSYNPYDTMPEEPTTMLGYPKDSVVDSINDYDSVDEDDLKEVTYDIVEGFEDNFGNVTDGPPVPPSDINPDNPTAAEEEYQLITIHQKPSVDISDEIDLTPAATPDDMNHIYTNLRDEFPLSPDRPANAEYDDPESLALAIPAGILPTKKGEYDDPTDVLQSLSLDDDNANDTSLPPPYSGLSPNVLPNIAAQHSPAFDDSIYSTPDTEIPNPETVHPLAPLYMQPYYHGRIPRPDAESLVRENGDFLVRESSNKPGQYVLTGLSNGRSQHLLLIDRSGKVKSKDREFESVPHLVKFFYERATSLTIGNCEVFLTHPIPVARQ